MKFTARLEVPAAAGESEKWRKRPLSLDPIYVI